MKHTHDPDRILWGWTKQDVFALVIFALLMSIVGWALWYSVELHYRKPMHVESVK